MAYKNASAIQNNAYQQFKYVKSLIKSNIHKYGINYYFNYEDIYKELKKSMYYNQHSIIHLFYFLINKNNKFIIKFINFFWKK